MGLFDDLMPATAGPPDVPRITVTPSERPAMPPEGRQLLDAIAGSESPGYNTKYGGGTFNDFTDHPRQAVPITTGPNAGKTSSAAGRYQFLGSTWDEVKKEAGLPDFSPDSQDAGAWHLANKTYQQRTGRDLTADLQSAKGDPNAIKQIGQALSKVWTSLPGGIEPNRATASFASRYDGGTAPTELSSQSRRSMGLFDDLVPQGQVAAPPVSGTPPSAAGGEPAQPAPVQGNTEGLSNRMAREGASPPVASAGEAFAGGMAKGASFNFADELAGTLAAGGFDPKDPVSLNNATALARGLWRRATGDTEAEAAYRVTSGAVRDAMERQRAQQPIASIGGELTGALATAPLTGGGGVVRGAGVGARALAGAKSGAIYGVIGGAGEGTDAETRATGAVTGGLLGAAVGGPLGAVLPAGKAATAVATAPELKAAARAGFESAPIKDLEVAPRAISEFGQGLRAKLNAAGIDENLAPKTFGVLSKVESVPADAAAVTGANLQSLRRTFQMAAGTPDKTERMAASKAIEAIDELIPNIAAKDILSGDPKAAAQAWATARGNYAAAMRSDEIAKAVIKAQRQAESAGSGANIDNATRQNFKAILNNDKRSRGFSADELAAMEQAVRGTTWGNFARLIGKAAPTGIVSGALSGGAGLAAGGPAGAILLPLAGLIGKKIGDRSTANQIARLDELVRSRAPLSNSMQEMASKVTALETTRSPRTMSAAVIAARNLSNNLKDAGISLSPGDIIRALQAPATGRAEDQQ
jgi:muramidase (phage lysozyme)